MEKEDAVGKDDLASERFMCSDGERAAFEAGIKLGGLFHQYVGTPLSLDNVVSLEEAIERACLVQPFVERIKVNIDRRGLSKKSGLYDYTTLTGDRLDVSMCIVCQGFRVEARLAYDRELEYPLMWIEDIGADTPRE